MENKIDFTLYNQIKAHFKAEEDKIILIHITSNNFADLKPQVFSNAEDFDVVILEIKKDPKRRYALFDFLETEPVFFYASPEFLQEQCLKTGKVLLFRKDPFPSRVFDPAKLKQEFALLEKLLTNPKAS